MVSIVMSVCNSGLRFNVSVIMFIILICVYNGSFNLNGNNGFNTNGDSLIVFFYTNRHLK